MTININHLVEALQDVSVVKQVIQELIEQSKALEEEYEMIKGFIIKETVNNRAEMFERFRSKGFSRKEALQLTLGVEASLKKGLGFKA